VPELAAIEPAESSGTAAQGQILVLHPTPDNEYKLAVVYQADVGRLTEDAPHPLGGQAHGSGILAACMAVAEIRKIGMQGPAWDTFMSRLAGNIARDLKRHTPDNLGYNGNNDSPVVFGRGTLRQLGGIYVNEMLYNGEAFE
jgi:hypothetical protein